MEYSSYPSHKRYIQKRPSGWFSVSQAGLGVGVIVGGLALVTTGSYAWWSAFGFPSVHGSFTLSPLSPTTTAFSLEPLASGVETTAAVIVPTTEPAPTTQPIVKTITTIVPTPTVSVPAVATIPEQMLMLVNQQRHGQGLTPLVLNSQLTAAAQAYASLMQQQHFFSHTSPNGITFEQRDEAAGYLGWVWLGENIAYGQQSVQEVMTSWMNSPEHRANILEPRAKELGIGYEDGSTPYWVQDFGAK